MRKILVFLLLLFLSNFFLFRPGLWLFQDGSFWYKTSLEITYLWEAQFYVFGNFRYDYGYDQGLLNFTRIIDYSYSYILFIIFGSELSQTIFSLTTYIVAFIAFYFFSGIFFKNKTLRFLLALLYTFNPVMYSFRGTGSMYAAVPLFLYSFYRLFQEKKSLPMEYLLLNILAVFLWISNIRLFVAEIFLVIPYGVLLVFDKKIVLTIKKSCILILSYILVFLPLIASFIIQQLEKTPGIFNYRTAVSGTTSRDYFYQAFNMFKTINIDIYTNGFYWITGILLFIFIVICIILYSKKYFSPFYFLNVVLFLFGITLFGLDNIFGDYWYSVFLTFFPFLTNGDYYAFYISTIPLIFLIGIIFQDKQKLLSIFAICFLGIGVLPFLNLSNFQFQKYSLSSVPQAYYEDFVEPYYGIPEPTYYIPGPCWRAQYMQDANTPTQCYNFGLHYAPILFDNPRVLSGESYYLSTSLTDQTNVDNLRVIYNLKDIIIPTDIVPEINFGPAIDADEVAKVATMRKSFEKNPLLATTQNPNFEVFSYKNKDDYDFRLYSPESIVYESLPDITDNKLSLQQIPVVFDKKNSLASLPIKTAQIDYKLSPDNLIKYYIHIHTDSHNPFLIQLNQSYGAFWKVIWISKNDYNSVSCSSNWEEFVITNNRRCIYKSSLLNLGDISLLSKSELSNNNHFMGNYIGNTWLIDPSKDGQNTNDLYAVVILEKQVFYSYAIAISTITVGVLVILAILSKFKKRK